MRKSSGRARNRQENEEIFRTCAESAGEWDISRTREESAGE
ncbi:hypothetical protein ACFOGI_13315 [Virgibacillus xinjiangensis]|uniref:Uncharacterized protein n=1 Tax=Virgibacillus xinjiangensis TaxID=393090 RepID=A0ABV7CY04_9BACI